MQVLVIGAGVIGLAVARTAAQADHEVTVAETTGGIANGVSSRNSEVIHAGLYYPTDSLRAQHCVEMIGGNAARAMEGELSCVGALWSPETGIIDSHSYMRALWGELEDRGGMITFATLVERMSFKAHPIMNRKSDSVLQLRCRTHPFSCL
jgi:L-2-hydroxyglutarate oxidase LhgO